MTDSISRAYIGSFTSQGGLGITVATHSASTGQLRPLHHTSAVPDPSYLAIDADAGVLYAVSEQAEGSVTALTLTDTDAPAVLGQALVGGASPTHLTVGAGRVATANYTSGSVSVLPLPLPEVGGPASAAPAVYQHQGSGPVAARQEGPHAHCVLTDPSGGWLLATDLGTDSVWVYPLDDAGPGLGRPTETALKPGSGPRHLAFHPDGRTVFVLNELDSTVTRCRWNPDAGNLEPEEATRVVPSGAGENYPSALAITADGKRLYIANRGHDSIAVLALDTPDGRPELAATVPCGGQWPRDLTLGPDDRHLYVANERSGDISWFHLGPDRDVPQPAGSVQAPAASCLVFG